MISVIRCDVTGDLRYCKVYVSVYGSEQDKKDAIAGLKSAPGGFAGR
jgi:ribosome-binding factor A